MEKTTTHPRRVEVLIDSDTTTKGEIYVECFNLPGTFYQEDREILGFDHRFQEFSDNDLIEESKVKVIEILHFKETKWWKLVEKNLLGDLANKREERDKLTTQITQIYSALNDPIGFYNKNDE